MIINGIEYGKEKVCRYCGWSFFGPGRVCDECRADTSPMPKSDEADPLTPPSRYHAPSNLSHIVISRGPEFAELYAATWE